MAKRIEKAMELFAGGCNCSQAVFVAFAGPWGLAENLAMRLASGLGGGMGRGEVCGAASGACLALGLACGYEEVTNLEDRKACGEKICHFLAEFEAVFGSVLCRDLLGYDPRDQEARERFAAHKKEICPRAIETAAALLVQMGI